jgi:OmpW family
MKKIKKTIIIFVLLLAGFTGFAQGGGIWNFQWVMGMPLGSTSDFIDQFSVRGFAIDGRGYVTDNLTVGGRAGWSTFYKDFGWVTETNGNYTINGYKRRYINTIPLTINAHYYFGKSQVLPYIGLGAGAYYVETRDFMGIYYLREKAWHFGLAPEAGVEIPFGNSNTGINFAVKYNYAAKTKDTSEIAWLEIDLGIAYIF